VKDPNSEHYPERSRRWAWVCSACNKPQVYLDAPPECPSCGLSNISDMAPGWWENADELPEGVVYVADERAE